MRAWRWTAVAAALALASALAEAQQVNRPLSPPGTAATQVLGKWVQDKADEPRRYTDGKWIQVTYGRPIKRGRDLFGSGPEYGKALNSGAPVWRAGANKSTRLQTEVPLQIGGKTVPAGDYSLFVELKSPIDWTFIVSSHAAQETFDLNEKVALWGSDNYTPDKDVTRAPMQVMKTNVSVDQFTIGFVDMTQTGGRLAIWWDTTMATVPFTVAP